MERAHARRYTRTPRQRKSTENQDRMSRTILRQVVACVALFVLAMLLGSGKDKSSQVVKTNLQSALTRNVNLEDLGRTLEQFVVTNPALSRIFRSKDEVQTFNPSAGDQGDAKSNSGSEEKDAGSDAEAQSKTDDATEPTGAQSSPPDWANDVAPVYITAVATSYNGKPTSHAQWVEISDLAENYVPSESLQPEEKPPDDAFDEDAKLSVKLKMPLEGEITSPFGYREHPTTGERTFHYGIDIAAAYGSRILAAADGTVLETGTDRAYGKYVILDHGNGVTTFYGHCSKILVSKGKKVTANTAIAKVGNSGISTGSHLHFEIRNGDIKVNPMLNLSE